MTLEPRRTLGLSMSVLMALSLANVVPTAGQSTTPQPSVAVGIERCVEPEATAEPFPEEALSMPEAFRIQLFEGVWQGIRDFYVDPEVNGLDWETIGNEYGRQIVRTQNAFQVYELLSDMVELLDDPYTGFFPPADLGDEETVDQSYGGIGALLDTSTAGADTDGLRIIYVFEEGSALESGIRPRDRIVAVDGDGCARIADIRGPEGTDVILTVVSPGEEPRDVVVPRRRINPSILPDAHRLETDPGIGYLRLNSLSGQETVDAIEDALTGFLDDEPVEGLILDVRATDLGAPGVVLQLLDTFVSGNVGSFHARLGDDPIEIEPDDLAADYADIPLAILVDQDSEAEAEQIAAILQDQGRAVVIGQETAGETHGTNNVDFPDGSLLQLVSFGFKLPDGAILEGQGITPDVLIDDDWLAFSEADDPGILAAIELIRAGDERTLADPVESVDEASPAPSAATGTDSDDAASSTPEPSPSPDARPTVTPIEG